MQIPAITPDYISPDARIKESDKPEKPEKKNLDVKNTKDQVDISTINHAVEQINKLLTKNDTHLEFSIHEKTKDIIVKVIDEETGELIREVPPERILNMVAIIWEQIGLLVDEKV